MKYNSLLEINKMKILIVTPAYPPNSRGGGGALTQSIARGLLQKGYKITVISGYYPDKMLIDKPLIKFEDEIETIWIPLIRIMDKKYPQLKGSTPPSLSSLIFLKKMDYNSYDIIHLNGFGHLLIDIINLFAKNSSKILTLYSFPKYVEKKGEANFLLKLLYKIYFITLGKYTLNSAKMITAISQFSLEECKERGIKENEIKVIEPGINLDKYKPVKYNEFEEKFQIDEKDILILSISRVIWYKGYEYAIKAIHKIIKTRSEIIKYVIIGSIEDENYYLKLKKQIEKLGISNNIIFTSFISKKLKLQAITRSNIFLAPSLHEGFGIVILEAMALGKSIIASNCEGFQCILDHMNTGILVEPANSDEISSAILLLIFNQKLREKLSNNALSNVKKYNLKNSLKKYEELYQKIL